MLRDTLAPSEWWLRLQLWVWTARCAQRCVQRLLLHPFADRCRRAAGMLIRDR